MRHDFRAALVGAALAFAGCGGGSGGAPPSPGTPATGGAPAPAPGTGGTGGTSIGGTGGAPAPAPDASLPPAMDAARDRGGGAPGREAGADRPPPPPPADAGPTPAALDAACTLQTAVFMNQNPATGGGKRFADTIPDPQAFIKERAKQDCLILYDDAANVRRTSQITLVIESPGSGVAATGGGRTGFSAAYIAGFGGNIATEINGVIAHEFTHIYQYNRGPGWMIEGMADYVRFKAGFFTLAQRRKGGNFDGSYRTTGFFIAWLDEQYPGFARKLNLAMKTAADQTTFQTLTGKPVETLWSEYQAAIP